MLKFDFTDKLTATLPSVPREHMIKFNNSWILDHEDAKLCHYIVVYRALVYKIDVDGHWEFANPAPKFPGQQGTPWCAEWAGPVGSAAAAGKIPEDRGGLYFDGVGVARISLTRSGVEPILSLENLQALEESIVIKSDQIILESDGLEDPRVFRWDGDYYLHTHSKLPNIARGQPAPEQPVYTGYSPNRRLMIEDEKNHTRKGLYVKITRLNEKNDNWSLGQSFFFGSNLSLNFEKNFGFFEERGILNAVYSVGHNGRPFTVFLGMQAGDKQVCQKFTRDMHLPTEEIQSNIKTNASPNTDSFKKIQNDYNKILLAPCLVMSNSAPLLENKRKGTWIGVGHARINHEGVKEIMDFFGSLACSVVPLHSRFKSLVMDKETAYTSLTQNHEFLTFVVGELRKNRLYLKAQLAAYLLKKEFQQVSQQDLEKLPDTDIARVFHILENGYLNSPLFSFTAVVLNRPHVMPWKTHPLSSSWVPDSGITLLHPRSFYLTFFYEMGGVEKGYRLQRFSDAYLFNNKIHPTFLQYATSLVPFGDDFILSMGENDQRASGYRLKGNMLEAMLSHRPIDFDVSSYQFKSEDSCDLVVLGSEATQP